MAADDGVRDVAEAQVVRGKGPLGTELPFVGPGNPGQVFLPLNVYSAHLLILGPEESIPWSSSYSPAVGWGQGNGSIWAQCVVRQKRP